MNILENKSVLNNKHTFYRAVVEDRNDPKLLNRVRVRILGIHSGDESKIPTNTLPWAEMSMPAQYGGQNAGIGISSVPVLGTWVWVFFDAGDWNRPIIVGSMYGIPTKNNSKTKGFSDPEGTHPVQKRLDEADTNRLANQNKFGETPIKKIKDANKVTGTPTATGEDWDELPEMTSSAKYPDNHVIETISGNFVEFDDTDGNSRMHWFHKSGTYWEVVEDGDYSSKVVRDHYEIVDRDVKRLVKRDETHTIQRNQEYKIDGWQEILIDGYSHEVINGYVFQEYDDYFHNVTQGYVKEEYKSYQHTIVDDYVKEEYKNYQHTIVTDYVKEEYKSYQHTIVTDYVKEEYKSTFDTIVEKANTQKYKDTLDTTVTKATTMTHKDTLDESVTGSVSKTYDNTYDLSVTGQATESYSSTYDKKVTAPASYKFNATYDLKAMGPATCTYNTTYEEKVTGPCNKKWSAGATIDGGPQIKITGGVILLN